MCLEEETNKKKSIIEMDSQETTQVLYMVPIYLFHSQSQGDICMPEYTVQIIYTR